MELTPPSYSCPVHQTDLTKQVKDALSVEAIRPFEREKSNDGQPFKVIATCPGGGDHPEPHKLLCSGTFTK